MTTVPARITFSGWGWRYPERRTWAVRCVDLVIEPGERVAVVGPSGAGKSTLLRAAAGVLADDPDDADDTAAAVEGTVLVDGVAPVSVRGRVGLVMQDPEAHTVMSRIGDDVAFGCENLGVERSDIWLRVRHALDVVGLDLPLDRSTTRLSGGQRQRLALAGVLAMRPGALVLDEPCANLDPNGVVQVHDAVRALLDDTGATLLVVEHRVGTWLDLVDRLVLLEQGGGVVADGAPDVVLAEHSDALERGGVWVPGSEPTRGSARSAGRDALRAAALRGAALRGADPRGRALPGAARAGGTPWLQTTGAGEFRPVGAGVDPDDARPSRAGGTPGPTARATPASRPLGAGEGERQAPPAPGGTLLLRAMGLETSRSAGRTGKRRGSDRMQHIGHDIDLEVRSGEVLAVTGPNGVGKSTLGLTLAGLLRPAGGTLEASSDLHGTKGAPTDPAPHSWSSRELAARIGTVFQDPEHQFIAASVREELAAGPAALGMPAAAIDERVTELLDTFRLDHLVDANPFTLSGGEQRRLAIAAVIATRPPVLVLDEPTSGQDRATWSAVVEQLGALADAGTAVVVVTHDRDLVRALDADEVVLHADGLTPAVPVARSSGESR
ncbi:ABC transporter ATP-binding protein [Curtobacterium sp. APC 4022]|uniref:ABC transporter ATP-binding protein n=1 Tax=Curtobacterium sp. APC 4022 TaxID=3035201 RepID=UPI0025B53820|nr:ABC transporter ATP-binding protein [Curtobacterium sp. APC 4022]MDN3479098.1 ABC transporter ATP-binding protein [Curtobacterium sp. APC 4022]